MIRRRCKADVGFSHLLCLHRRTNKASDERGGSKTFHCAYGSLFDVQGHGANSTNRLQVLRVKEIGNFFRRTSSRKRPARISPDGPLCPSPQRGAYALGRVVGMVIFTVSPLRPGKPANIASTMLGITTSIRLVSERAWARPSNSGALVPACRMWRSTWL